MNQPSRRPAARRSDGLTALAVAAGLALGHIVEAMAKAGPGGAATAFAAFVFVFAGMAATACALAAMAAGSSRAPARSRIPSWIVAIGAGVLAALAPNLI